MPRVHTYLSLDGSEVPSASPPLACISRVYTPERAQAEEGQDSKWPDESVTLGKFHPRAGEGSENVSWQIRSDRLNRVEIMRQEAGRRGGRGGREDEEGWTTNAENHKSFL